MCTTRLRLLLPGEPATDDIHVIHPLQVLFDFISMQKILRRPFCDCASVCMITLAHKSFPFQGGPTAPEIHVRSNSRPN